MEILKMSLIATRTVAPFPGKFALAAERARTLAGIYASHGAKARVTRVVTGDMAGQIVLLVAFDDGKSMTEIYEKYQADPAWAKLREEHGLNPAGTLTGPDLYRFVYGRSEPGYPVVLQREYTVARDKVADVLAMMPELDAMMKQHDISVAAATPVFSSDMTRLIAAYRLRSSAHLGAAIDGVGMSAEFQSLVGRAAALGTLARSRVLADL
jgi:hypothetical protein